jgi:hypothetical protein
VLNTEKPTVVVAVLGVVRLSPPARKVHEPLKTGPGPVCNLVRKVSRDWRAELILTVKIPTPSKPREIE